MGQGKLYQVEGIVLARRDHREADRIVTFLTPHGRLDLVAAGVRKPRSRKAGHLELFCSTKLLVSRVTGSWDIISQAEVLNTRVALREDFMRGTYARYIAELALRFFDEESDETLYVLVDLALTLLETAADPQRVARWYEPELLALAGFRPEWDVCQGERSGKPCRRALHPRPTDPLAYGMDVELGGALCPECAEERMQMRTVQPLSPSALSWLQAFQRRSYEELADLNLPTATAAELERAMEMLVSYYLERRPSVLRMVREK